MRYSVARALVGAWLVVGCAAGRVERPPQPPAFDPGEKGAEPRAETPAPEAASAASPEPAKTPDEQEQKDAAKPPTGPAANPPLGWIAGQPLEPEELLLEWGDVDSREMWLVLDKLVTARLALAEAGRLGIRLAPEAVERRFEGEKQKLEAELARGKEPRTLDQYIERDLGFDPARYLDRVRRATIRQMLAERAVRAGSLAAESVAARVIVVATAEDVEKVRAALAAGREFADVATELSVDESRTSGGLVPYVVSQERSPIARLAFQTPVGEVAGPIPVGDHQFWIRVEERRKPLEGDWATVESTVEASLAEHPVADPEFVHWKLTVEGRYPIDFGPLKSLFGAAP